MNGHFPAWLTAMAVLVVMPAEAAKPRPLPLADDPDLQCVAKLRRIALPVQAKADGAEAEPRVSANFNMWAAVTINRAAIARKIKANDVLKALGAPGAAPDARLTPAEIETVQPCFQKLATDAALRGPLSPAHCSAILGRQALQGLVPAIAQPDEPQMMGGLLAAGMAWMMPRIEAKKLLIAQGMSDADASKAMSAAHKQVSDQSTRWSKKGLLPEWDFAGCRALLAPPVKAEPARP